MNPHQQRQDDENLHKAHVDETSEPAPSKFSMKKPILKRTSAWEVTDNDEVIKAARKTEQVPEYCEQVISVLKGVRGNLIGTTKTFLAEGTYQYAYSVRRAIFQMKDIRGTLKSGLRTTWSVLAQPVWVPRKNRPPKEMSRGSLFVMDVFRFGGTFAAIFVALFVSLNYESFFQIITPYLDPVERISALHGSVAEVDKALREKLLKSTSLATAGREEGNLLSYLPEVGPPENRIIVPRLKLNVPLVTPSFSSLLREDWEGVEEDIQEALKQGVVHYPGTARPGQAGNFFVTGHSSYYPWAEGGYKSIFARLHELTVGDEYWVYYGGDKHRYVITGKKEVKPGDVTVRPANLTKRHELQ